MHGEIESNNPVDKFVVTVKNDGKIVGHLPLKKTRKFAKTIFHFLWADPYGKWNVAVTSKAVNVGDGDGMQVPCVVLFCA